MANNEERQEQQLKGAKRVFDTMIDFLEDAKLNYERDDENLAVTLGLSGEDLPMVFNMRVIPGLEAIVCASVFPFTVPEDKASEVSLIINLVNVKMQLGNFEFNPADGRISFRVSSNYTDSIIGKNLFAMLLTIANTMVEEYNDKFFMYIKGKIDIDDFFGFSSDDEEE